MWVYTPKSRRGLSKKLLHNWHGPYRIVEKLGPVHYRLRTTNNKPVTTTVHATRMKLYIDPESWPINPPFEGELPDGDLDPSDIPKDSLVASGRDPDQSSEIKNDDQNTVSLVRENHQNSRATNSQDSLVSDTSHTSIDSETIFNGEKILKMRVRDGKLRYLLKWVGFPVSMATLGTGRKSIRS